ncbi:MAG: epoxide hydrolase [Acidobacteriota bacterium]|nr:epoxide hydrolase [Acidobacteriota bacterium]
MTDITPYRIEIDEEELTDLRRRLAATRWPENETVDDWTQGIPLAYTKEVCEYWASSYDWRRLENRLNDLDQFRTEIDGLGIHFLHLRSKHRGAAPLVMTHGWPGSIVEFLEVFEPLLDPTAHGGSEEDAFHLVVPALPGFGFSDKPSTAGWSVEKIAYAWAELMSRLGYEWYFAQGGDWGAAVSTAIAIQDHEHCHGIHLNMPTSGVDRSTMDDLTDIEKDALAGLQHYQDWDSGYSKQQSTRPQTLGYGLVDSPAGQAAWTRDQLLDNVMMYWLPACGASSGRLYWESFGRGGGDPVEIPVGCSIFPKEIFRSSRRWAERRYRQLVYWNRLEKGGHFAAFEVPDVFVDELRKCFRVMRA